MKCIKNVLLLLIIAIQITSCIQTAEIETIIPVKNQFFPLSVDNIYIYDEMGGLFFHKVIGHDTISVINKSIYKDFEVYRLSNDQVYYLKNDSVFDKSFTEENEPVLYFWAAKKLEKREIFIDKIICCVYVEIKPIGDYKIGNKVYKNCYKCKVSTRGKFIIAQGIGIISYKYPYRLERLKSYYLK